MYTVTQMNGTRGEGDGGVRRGGRSMGGGGGGGG